MSHKQFPGEGIDIDAIHRTWPHQRKLFRQQRQPAHVWVMVALFAGFLIGLALGVIA